jgi:hypothetical protein
MNREERNDDILQSTKIPLNLIKLNLIFYSYDWKGSKDDKDNSGTTNINASLWYFFAHLQRKEKGGGVHSF